jgi:WD40 repeat protein
MLRRRLAGLAHGVVLAGAPGTASGITSLALAPDGKTLAAGGSDRVVHVWEMSTGEQRSYEPVAGHP